MIFLERHRGPITIAFLAGLSAVLSGLEFCLPIRWVTLRFTHRFNLSSFQDSKEQGTPFCITR